MKLIDDIRRENLAALVHRFGSIAELARRLARSESQVNQWLHGAAHSVTGKPRGMRPASARFIEGRCGEPTGWLDTDHHGLQAQEPHTQAAPAEKSWAAFHRASPTTRAAVELLLLPKKERDALARAHDEVLAGIRLLEANAEKVLSQRKSAA